MSKRSHLGQIILLLLSSITAFSGEPSEQEQRLQKAFNGQVLIIRNFYTADEISYSSDGSLVGNGGAIDWMSAQLVVRKVRLQDGKLLFEGDRVQTAFDTESWKLTNIREDTAVKIKITLGSPAPSDHELKELIGKVFVTSAERLEDLVPESDKGILSEAAGKAVLAKPKALQANPAPEFTDEARKRRIAGTLVLAALIGSDGRIPYVKLVHGLGYGLDDAAIRTVRAWKFSPATWHGRPVPAWMPITVTFSIQ